MSFGSLTISFPVRGRVDPASPLVALGRSPRTGIETRHAAQQLEQRSGIPSPERIVREQPRRRRTITRLVAGPEVPCRLTDRPTEHGMPKIRLERDSLADQRLDRDESAQPRSHAVG